MDDYQTYEIWLPISERAVEQGLESLTVQELTFHCCFEFAYQFENSGLSSYGYNVDSIGRAALVAALRRIEANETAELMERANAILNRSVSTEVARTWDHFLAVADPEGELETIHDELTKSIESDGVRKKASQLAAQLAKQVED